MLRSNIEDKIPDITNLATNTTLNSKINQVKNKTLSILSLKTNASLNDEINEVKNKISSITNLATSTALTVVENKIPGRGKYITTPESNRLTAENLTLRLKQANLANKDDTADSIKGRIP